MSNAHSKLCLAVPYCSSSYYGNCHELWTEALPLTFIYNWTVFIPRITWPTWDNIFPADTTRANAGSFISSCSWARHFRSSDKSTLVPNLSILEPGGAFRPGTPEPFFFRPTLLVESFESESDKFVQLVLLEALIPAAFSLSSCNKNNFKSIFLQIPGSIYQSKLAITSTTHLETVLETRRLVLSIFGYRRMRPVTDARPSASSELWIPVFVRRLLDLRPHFDRVFWVGLDEGFGGK